MTRSAEIAFSASENRFTSEAVEYRVEAWGDTPIGQLFASIRTKLRSRKAGRVACPTRRSASWSGCSTT